MILNIAGIMSVQFLKRKGEQKINLSNHNPLLFLNCQNYDLES